MPISITFVSRGKEVKDAAVRSRIRFEMRRTLIEIVQLLRVSPLVPRDRLILAGSFVSSPVRDDGRRIFGAAGSPQTHALVQDEGRRPGSKFPPPKPIEGWILRKGILKDAISESVSNAKKAGVRSLRGFTPSNFRAKGRGALARELRQARSKKSTRSAAVQVSSLLRGLTFAISGKIASKGIDANRFYEDIRAKIQPIFRERIAGAIGGGRK